MGKKVKNTDGQTATKFGTQPVYDMIIWKGWTLNSVIGKLDGITRYKLHQAIHGMQAPNEPMRKQLPVLFEKPLEELFTEKALASEPIPRGGFKNRVHYAVAEQS